MSLPYNSIDGGDNNLLINNVNESTFNARMLTYDVEPATVITYTDWLRQSLNPLNYGKKEQYKAITITFLIKDKDKASCMTDISNLSNALEQATLKFDDLPYYYDAILSGTPAVRTFLEGKKYYLDVSLQAGYAYLQPVSTILSDTSQTITAQGNLSSPAIVTLTPTQDIDSVSFTGLTKKPITVNNLHSGAPITINGEVGIVTEPDLDTIMTPAMGAGKWLFRKYSMVSLLDPDVMRIYMIPTKSMIPFGSLYTQSLLSDRTDIYHNQGGNDYLGYVKTAVKVSTAKSITLNFCHDDGVNVYFDGTSVYNKDYPESNDAKWAGKANVSISLTANAWHKIEILWLQHYGDDGIWNFSNTLSSQVDQLNAYYARDTNTAGMVNKFPDTDMWSFPVIQPGNNKISVDNSACSVTVAYKPKFI